MPDWSDPLIVTAAALFLLSAVVATVKGPALTRAPFMLLDVVATVLLFLLIGAMAHGGHSTLEKVNLCATPSNLAGCPGYSAPVIDAAHDIPETTVPTIRPTYPWMEHPGR